MAYFVYILYKNQNNFVGYVYLIRDPITNTYKIGVTRKLDGKRIKKLQTGNSAELQLMYTYHTLYPFRLETMLHNRFNQYNVLNEWYELPDDIVLNFLNICKDTDNVIKSLLDNPFFSKNIK